MRTRVQCSRRYPAARKYTRCLTRHPSLSSSPLATPLLHYEPSRTGLEWVRKLGERASSWSRRFVCQFTTYLIYSTQRCESINSAVKEKVTRANMKLVDVCEGLIQYNIRSRDRRAVDSIRLAIRQHHSASQLPSWLERMRSKVTSYAFDLILAQFARALCYTATLLPGNDTGDEYDADLDPFEQPYTVVLTGSQMTRTPVVFNDDTGELESCSMPDEFLLVESTRAQGRTTTLHRCSCLFDVSSGLDLCVHRCKLMINLVDSMDASEVDNICF